MRRTDTQASPLSLLVLGLGVFLLVLAGMLTWYVEPQAKRTPIDVDQTTVFTGKGKYFDTGQVKTVSKADLTVTRQVRGDVDDSSDEVAVWDVVTSVDYTNPEAAPDDPKRTTLPASSPHDSFQWTQERWVTDRETNRPVHCCQEEPYFEGEAYLKFPFDVQERSYTWWDNTLGATVPLTYEGKAKIEGYEGLKFVAEVAPVKTGTRQVPGALVGSKASQVLAEEWYENHGIELVVDQRTGRVINAAIGPRKTLRAPGADADAVELLDSERIEFTTATKKAQVALAKDDSKRLKMVGETLPVGAGALGLVLVVVGGVLVVRGRERPQAGPPAGAPAPAPVSAPV